MKKSEYEQIVLKNKIKPKKTKNLFFAFFSGGIMGIIAQLFYFIGQKYLFLSPKDAGLFSTLVIIIITTLLTGLGIYKKIAAKCGAGLFIPTSGFANSVISSSIESKFEGPIFGIGSRMFYLAGSVITYSIVASFFYALIRLILSSFGVSL